ncbi:APC family permease [Actinoplanes sp. NPDC051851]|uniref:APC family permease n=1 Tax=Actinoplanes sp. NPDC051851 TaxID=3154753 RepID=UPI00344962A2
MAATTAYPADDLQRFGYQGQLKRILNTRQLAAFGMNYMLPISPMAVYGAVYAVSGGMVVLAYLIGMVALMFTAASYGQMVKAFPLSGSVYNYVGRGIGAPFGFLAGWSILLDYFLVPSLLYLVAASSTTAAAAPVGVLAHIPAWAWFVSFVLVNTVINWRGIRMTSIVITLTLILELTVLAIVVFVGLWAVATGRGHWTWSPLYNSSTFSWHIVLAGTSVALLSFLGFDGISLLAEEAQDAARRVRTAMLIALAGAGVLFIAQTWVAAMLTPDPAALIANGDPAGTAFSDALAVAGGHWIATLCLVATALAWGLPDSMAAQAAVSRLLFAMARDKQLPSFLAKVSRKHNSPVAAILVVSVLNTALGLYMLNRADGTALLGSWINFGALIAFTLLHVTVIYYYLIRRRSRNLFSHLLVPLIGLAIIGTVMWNARTSAQLLGLAWFGLGVLVMLIMYAVGRRPSLPGMAPAHSPTPVRQAV